MPHLFFYSFLSSSEGTENSNSSIEQPRYLASKDKITMSDKITPP